VSNQAVAAFVRPALARVAALTHSHVNESDWLFRGPTVLVNARWLPPHTPARQHKAISEELKSGIDYVRHNRLMMTLTILVTISTFLAMPLLTMLPAFATEVLTGAGSHETRLSLLMASQGLGAIVGALVVGSLGGSHHLGRVLLGVQILLGLIIAGFAQSTSLPLSLVLLFAGGMFFMALFSISFSLLQLAVPDNLRGRVVSIYMVALRGGGPIGSLVAGALADRFSSTAVMMAFAFYNDLNHLFSC
jgi:predicted MFS family arabinose efflux permease